MEKLFAGRDLLYQKSIQRNTKAWKETFCCVMVFFSTTKNVQILRNKALRRVYGEDGKFSRIELYKVANVLPICGLYTKQVCGFIYKTRNFKHKTRGKSNVILSIN